MIASLIVIDGNCFIFPDMFSFDLESSSESENETKIDSECVRIQHDLMSKKEASIFLFGCRQVMNFCAFQQ